MSDEDNPKTVPVKYNKIKVLDVEFDIDKENEYGEELISDEEIKELEKKFGKAVEDFINRDVIENARTPYGIIEDARKEDVCIYTEDYSGLIECPFYQSEIKDYTHRDEDQGDLPCSVTLTVQLDGEDEKKIKIDYHGNDYWICCSAKNCEMFKLAVQNEMLKAVENDQEGKKSEEDES